jgi:ABC-type Na+ transport system ATPase subunit NatA
VALPQRLSVRQNLRVFGRLYGVADVPRRIDELPRTRLADRTAKREAIGRAEDPCRALSAHQPLGHIAAR